MTMVTPPLPAPKGFTPAPALSQNGGFSKIDPNQLRKLLVMARANSPIVSRGFTAAQPQSGKRGGFTPAQGGFGIAKASKPKKARVDILKGEEGKSEDAIYRAIRDADTSPARLAKLDENITVRQGALFDKAWEDFNSYRTDELRTLRQDLAKEGLSDIEKSSISAKIGAVESDKLARYQKLMKLITLVDAGKLLPRTSTPALPAKKTWVQKIFNK
jgi:hypothetical protein